MQAQLESLVTELKSLWRFRWPAAITAWAVALIGWAVVLLMPPSFEAQARVYVDATSALRPLLQGLAVDQNVDAQLNYVRQTMLSRPALEKVARQTELDLRAKTPTEREHLIDSLQKKILIEFANGPEKSADKLYTITYQDSNRPMALAVVTKLLNTFVEDSMGAGRAGSANAQRFLRDQIKEVEQRLAEDEARVAEFRKKNFGLMPGEQGDYYTRLQNETEALKKTQSALAIATTKREALSRQLHGETPFAPGDKAGAAGGGSPLASSDTTFRLKEAESKLEELKLKYTDKHPEVMALEETIEQLKARRTQELAAIKRGDPAAASLSGLSSNPVYQNIQLQLNQTDVEVASLKGEIADRQQRIAELDHAKNVAPEIEAEFARLNRSYGVTKAQYTSLVERLEKAKLSEQATDAGSIKFEVIDPPAAKIEPVKPNRPLLTSVVFLAALGVGVGLAWLLGQLRPVYDSAHRVAEDTGLPILGAVSRTGQAAAVGRQRVSVLRFTAATAALLVVYLCILILQAGGFLPTGLVG
jgi:polysaccharide chain length determinant protein (PEP-CTERM system associated)